MSKIPTVVIIGRINTGKSSFFNRLTETGKALVSKIEGTTRDYNSGEVRWRNKIFEAIDTGGVDIDILKHSVRLLLPNQKKIKKVKADSIEEEIIIQTKTALEKADLILMLVDVKAGVMPDDKKLALVLKKIKTPVMLVCNKVDNQKWRPKTAEFFKLGLGQPYPVSAINGSGTGDFLDELIKKIKWPSGRPKKEVDKAAIKVAMIGKPNVGKSSLVNQILGEKRVIVSDVPQTTREPQDTEIIYKNQKIILIDTAGLRKKPKIKPGLEKMATKKALDTINSADVVLLVTEVDKPLVRQDSYLAGLLKEAGNGLIIVANKWDLLIDKDSKIDSQVIANYQRQFPYLAFAPVIFISAATGRNVDKILDLILKVSQERQKEIDEEKLEEILKKAIKHHRPAQAKGQNRPRLYSIKQTKTNPPEFTITVGQGQSLHFSYTRFIENQIRYNFGFLGVPVRIKIKTE